MDPEAATAAEGSQAAGLAGGSGAASAAFVPAHHPPLDDRERAAAAAFVDRRMPAIQGASKAELLRLCHAAGLPGNNNDTKRKLTARLAADLRRRAEEAVRADSAARRGHLGRVAAPSASEGQALLPASHPAAPPDGPSGSTGPGCFSQEAGAAPASGSRGSSPVPPAGKRPRADAPPFLPSAAPYPASPATAAPSAGTIGAGRHRPARPAASMSDPVDARRRSHAAASARPARIDELLELQGELRRWQCCLRGLMDCHDETPEELLARVEVVVAELADPDAGAVEVSDCWRVGRYAPERPRPVIIRFRRLCDKVSVLRGKGVLYGDGISDILKEWAAGLEGGMGAALAAFVPAHHPPLDDRERAAAAAFVDRRMPAIQGASKAELLRQCHAAGLPGNNNDTKRKLVARLAADLRGRAEAAVRADSAARCGQLGRVAAPSASEGQALLPASHPAAPPDGPRGSTGPGCFSQEAGAAPASGSRGSSPVPPAGKRPRADAPPFLPSAAPSLASPAAAAPSAGTIGAGRHRPARPAASMSDPVDARRRSHAAASARPARIDELLELQGELRRWQCCLRGLMDCHDETPEELLARVEVVVAELADPDDGAVEVSDC
ncbi:unnamed protein product, partial [Ostreobium quekettii]